MRLKFVLPLLLFFCVKIHAQGLNQNDGPYVFYDNGKVIVQSIEASGYKTDSFPEIEKSRHPLSIHFSNHTCWDFTVTLKKNIQNEPSVWKKADKIIALSDIEGEFEAFRNLLIANKVMDSTYQWIFGKGQLVICGDLFDRGNDITAELWLLYKLEEEAKGQGGYVHTILGNHDIMNLSGDFRYVQKKYFEHAKMMGKNYAELYGQATELGRWLRSKNIMERIGDYLCLHGGVSATINARQMSLPDINNQCRPFYALGEHPEKFTDRSLWDFFNDSSPFWYRGYFLEPKATESQIDSTLALYHCAKIIVGHTIVDNIVSLYHGKVIAIDVNEHEGNSQGLLMENRKDYKIKQTGLKELLE
jgi:Calcineurin-like phosphoesterase